MYYDSAKKCDCISEVKINGTKLLTDFLYSLGFREQNPGVETLCLQIFAIQEVGLFFYLD